MLHVRSNDQFFTDADDGTLSAFSIVDPDFDACSEENPQDIRKGESFAAEVINGVMRGKGWPRTLLTDFTVPLAFLVPPSLPEPSLKWGSW